MILFIDQSGLNNEIAIYLGQNHEVIFAHGFQNVEIKGQFVTYISIKELIVKKVEPEIIVLLGDLRILGFVYNSFPQATIVSTLGTEIPAGIPVNVPFTLVTPPGKNIKELLYEKMALLTDVVEIDALKEWDKLISRLKRERMNLTMKESQNLKILMIKRSRLAEAPDELAKAINRYTPHHADVGPQAKTGYNILHYHNVYTHAKHDKKLIQYHSEPSRVTFPYHFRNLPTFPKKQLVISQYHATLPEYRNCQVVKNVINFDDPSYTPTYKNRNKIKIGYSPSTTSRVNEYYDKGYEQTKKILESIDGIEFDIINGVSLKECIKRKADCDIIIDECVTGSFHRSGLEGLALGKMTICWLKPKVEEMLKNLVQDRIPFENINIDNLQSFLISKRDSPIEDIHAVGKKNREWMEEHWNPKHIAESFIEIYKGL